MNFENLEFKEKFSERIARLTDIEEFRKYSALMPRRSIRVNTLKISIEDLRNRLEPEWKLTQIPWCKEGFWIEKPDRRDVGNLIEHALGYFYVQEAASMVPPVVLDAKPGEMVLDMCAAPGSKATQIAAMMENKGVLVANDYKGIRLAALGINLERMGVFNSVVTMMMGYNIKGIEFDKILVDAPCSGTGTIRKSLKTVEMWNPLMIKRLAKQQKALAKTAFNLLKTGGRMVYSTCSVEPEEDEETVDFLLKEFPNARLEKIDLPIKRSAAVLEIDVKEYNKEISKCLRIWPQDNNTDGFFVASVRKD